MPLDPQAAALLAILQSQPAPPIEELSVPFVRQMVMGYTAMQGDPLPMERVEDLVVPGPAGALPVRVYTPTADAAKGLIVYFHGGGWVIGNVELVDRPCRRLAFATGCVLASVEYRLSPETKYPGAAEDAFAATTWFADHADRFAADPGRLIVAGDSAGGNLAAAVTLMARDRGGPTIAMQYLHCPVTAPAVGSDFASYQENAEGYLLTRGAMEWFWDHYVGGTEGGPYAAPLLADDFTGLPPAVIVVAGYDPLRDEGVAYADRLVEAGVAVSLHRWDGQMHDFAWMPGMLDAAGGADRQVADAIVLHVR